MRLLAVLSAALLSALLAPAAHAQNATRGTNPVAALPQGVSLPRSGTAYALDTSASGPALIQLHPSEIVSNSHAAGNFARSFVYAGAQASVELKGLNAAINLKSAQPSFLGRINGDDPELMRSRVHLIRLDQGHDRRVVSTYSQNVFGGQRAKHYNDIAISKKDAEPDAWLMVTPETPLTPGEYGIVFMPKDTNLTPDSVYDFNVAIESAKPDK